MSLSRERIRLAMHTAGRPQPAADPALEAGLLERLKSEPATRVALEALSRWWDQYPLQALGTQLARSARSALVPVAQRNPLGLVLAAFLAGGLLVLAKPWRWVSLPAICAGILPQLLLKLVAQAPVATRPSGSAAVQGQAPEHENQAHG